jgi:hypothetical protein
VLFFSKLLPFIRTFYELVIFKKRICFGGLEICLFAKKKGGLGLPNLKARNSSFIAKHL